MDNSQANDFSAKRLLLNQAQGQSSRESTDSGCCEGEHIHKPFDAFSLMETSSNRSSNSTFHSFSPPQQHKETESPPKRATDKKEMPNGSNGASYKYLSWREKDRRRRFREEWKHLWLVVPYGSYEVSAPPPHKNESRFGMRVVAPR